MKATKTLKQLRKATYLTNRAMHKNGPKSFKKGMGALVKVLYRHDGTMQAAELVETLGFNRAELKTVVKKAQEAGYVTMGNVEGKHTYEVTITDTGTEIVEKRLAAQEEAAQKILEGLSAEEVEQLNALTDKLIVASKAAGAHGKYKGAKKSHKHGKRCHGYKKDCTKAA